MVYFWYSLSASCLIFSSLFGLASLMPTNDSPIVAFHIMFFIAFIGMFLFFMLGRIFSKLRLKNFRAKCWNNLLNDKSYYNHCKECYENNMAAAFGDRDDYYIVPQDLVEAAIYAKESKLPKQLSIEDGYMKGMFSNS